MFGTGTKRLHRWIYWFKYIYFIDLQKVILIHELFQMEPNKMFVFPFPLLVYRMQTTQSPASHVSVWGYSSSHHSQNLDAFDWNLKRQNNSKGSRSWVLFRLVQSVLSIRTELWTDWCADTGLVGAICDWSWHFRGSFAHPGDCTLLEPAKHSILPYWFAGPLFTKR